MNSKKLNNLSSSDFLLPYQESLSKKYYQKILAYDLILKQNLTTPMQLPRVEKIVLNTTSKSYVNEKKKILSTLAAFELISGQKPKLTYARKSVANFQIRQHQIIGCKIVLSKTTMYMFLDKLSKIIFPRIREFQKKSYLSDRVINQPKTINYSVSKQNRNFSKNLITHTLGFQNPMIFPELENHFDLVENFRGMNCTFILSKCTLKTGLLVLSGFQLPVFFDYK